jgi:hypothetical protein
MKRKTFVIAAATVAFANIAMASIFLFHELLNFTSSNSVLYFLRGRYGGVEIRRDLLLEEADRLIFMVDANRLFNYVVKGMAVAENRPILELTWDEKVGVGHVKQFRPDGTALSFPFSRFEAGGRRPQGLFLGGDLPYGDSARSNDRDTSGMSYYDGKDWHHVWCAIDEGFKALGEKPSSTYPLAWDFKGSRVLKHTPDEIILESDHALNSDGNRVTMERFASFRAGDDYFVLKVKITNEGSEPVSYGYSWGDEPWVGEYGASRGDVGWYEGGVIKYEQFISPARYRYVGYWDHGNDAAGEGRAFAGHANFVEWFDPAPSLVFLSNSIEDCCDETRPLYSATDRVISLVWLNQLLLPGQSRTYTLALGMATAGPGAQMPVKPVTVVN